MMLITINSVIKLSDEGISTNYYGKRAKSKKF